MLKRLRSQSGLSDQEAQAPPPGSSPLLGPPEQPEPAVGAAGSLLPFPKPWTGGLNLTFSHRKPAMGVGHFSDQSSAQLTHSGKYVCAGVG